MGFLVAGRQSLKMTIAGILQWLESSALASTIRDGLLLFPLLESIHVIGLALVFGTIAIIDLRLLGAASAERPFKRMASDILKWTWAAFALTAVTGALMFITNADVYYHNFYFRTKMLLLVLAGINMASFELTLGRAVHRWDKAPSAPPAGKAVAILSLAIWISVIFAGRLIGFSTSRAKEAAPSPADSSLEELFQTTPGGAGATSNPVPKK
ncbi:MAG: hypothetical protein JO307_04850 [Bryobacterales bacterium]|nr:hypothetical protein [Bryobacterales bacterium]MBV9400490.1 hypothetical protein [Bryobacterales bacterium]